MYISGGRYNYSFSDFNVFENKDINLLTTALKLFGSKDEKRKGVLRSL
jgi:hypothetical protein